MNNSWVACPEPDGSFHIAPATAFVKGERWYADKVAEHVYDAGDAALIAAAPDMLAALKLAADMIEHASRRYYPKSIRNADRFELENVNAAIHTAIYKSQGDKLS